MRQIAFLVVVLLLTACGAEGLTPVSRPKAAPIDAPLDTWQWVEFDDAVCGNGAPTGIGVNLTERSNDVFVYFMGGGACWDTNSCLVLRTSVNVESGYDEGRFATEPKLGSVSFDRENDRNPFRDMSFVFVPYCTGDVHVGDNVATYEVDGEPVDVHHRGAANVEAYLERLAPTFEDAERVFVAGSSAGGFGAQLNFHRFAEAFDHAEVHALSDSAPLVQPSDDLFAEWKSGWGVSTPAACDACGDGFPQWFDYLTTTYPGSRFALLSYSNDQIIRLFFGYPVGSTFRETLRTFVEDHVGPAASANSYIIDGGQHVLMVDGLGTEDVVANELGDWLNDWANGEPDWTSVGP